MLYGLKLIGVMGGHGDGANAIPNEYAVTPELAAYREGTAMRQLAAALGEIPGVVNLRPEATDISWAERARRLHDAGCDLGLELHTNWSINSKTGKPNTGVFLVIVAMHNPVHGKTEQEAMAEQLFAPLAADMGMRLEIRTKDGTGGGHDWYSFLDACNRRRVPYPMIVEHGYHPDFARDVAGNTAKAVARWHEIAGRPAPRGARRLLVHAGVYADRAAAAAACERARDCGYHDAYVHTRGGVCCARCALHDNIAYAMDSAQTVAIKTGLEAGIIITAEEEL